MQKSFFEFEHKTMIDNDFEYLKRKNDFFSQI